MKESDKKLLQNNGWKIISIDPTEILHEDRSRASGIAVEMVIDNLKHLKSLATSIEDEKKSKTLVDYFTVPWDDIDNINSYLFARNRSAENVLCISRADDIRSKLIVWLKV